MNLISQPRAALALLQVLAIALAPCRATAQAPSTSTFPPWPTLASVTNKYEGVPLAAVESAAENGEVTAQHYLGFCYTAGVRVALDLKTGISWYEKALKQNYLPSGYNLARIYESQSPGFHDEVKALYYFQYTADKGFVRSKVELARFYRNGIGVPPDPARAVLLLEQAADQGEGDAMFDLFSMFADGLGVARDYDRAMRWLEKDAATGDAQAQSALAYQYENNFRLKHDGYYFPQFPNEYEIFPQFPNVGAQLREAVRLETLAAKQGVFPSQMRLADLYLKGAYVEQDEERALEIIRGAADHGYSPALSKLADLYAHGIGEPRDDHDRVFELLCRAALSSDPTKTETYWIYSAIIERCEAGFGTDRDLVAAAQWYCRAALRNSVDYFGRAYYPLADKFDLIPPATAHDDHATRPVSAQLRPVLAACLKAAARRDAQAAIQLGTMYLTGKDAPRDAAKAWPWFNLASQYGATEAASNVSQAESKMTAAELVEARRQFPAFLQELQKIAATASIQAGRPGNP